MFEIRGEYNTAHVMIDGIDQTTYSQIQSFLNDPAFRDGHIAIMPDCHAGKGSCIGFTMPIGDAIIPDIVGVDIGCGMLSAKFPTEYIDVVAFDNFIRKNIPAGFAMSDQVWNGEDFFTDTAKKIGMNLERVSKSIGTLGGGNHFIEAGRGADGKIWVTIHSGSRNFGLQIAKFHSNKAKELTADKSRMPYLPTHSIVGYNYIKDQRIGVQYAQANRKAMMTKIAQFFDGAPVQVIESIHNYIDADGMIRKGATSACDGEYVIIPFNMRDGLAICRGKGNAIYNNSAPHGAGRILSRSKAKATLDVDYFREDMRRAGVYTTTADSSTLDEAPDAYKDKDIILQNIKDTVDIVEMVVPIYNFKSSGD